MSNPVLHVDQLNHSYGSLRAVDDVSFQVQAGEIMGLLGPNGAGKTTTINIVCGLLTPDSGRLMLDGQDLQSGSSLNRQHLGVVPQDVALYQELSGIDNLKFWGEIYGLRGSALKKRVDELLDQTGLTERARDRVNSYSGGMKRRLNLAIGMIHEPDLLLLDEPTVGIDPQARHNMLDVIRETARAGTAILYTTHYLDEAEQLCDRIAIIDQGRILAQGTQQELQNLVGENRLIHVTGSFSPQAAEAVVKEIKDLDIITLSETKVVYSLPIQQGAGQVLEHLIKSGVGVENLRIKEPSLDSVFIKLTGRELRD